MARKLRIEMAGGVFHVTSRGDRREEIYRDKSDRRLWFSIFGDVCERFNWRCHSFCLMVNHYHLVLETPEATLSKGMRHLNGVFTQAFNRRHGLVGHLFQGRFKSILVEKDSYLLELARYVPLNPVRSGITENAGEWPWSSYRQTLGEEPAPSWLDTDWVLGQFHSDLTRARQLFIEFVRSGIGRPSVWDSLKKGVVLGSEKFLDEVSRKYIIHVRSNDIDRAEKRQNSKSLQDFKNDFASPRTAMAEAYKSGGYTMEEIAKYFGVHRSTVCRAVKANNDHRESEKSPRR